MDNVLIFTDGNDIWLDYQGTFHDCYEYMKEKFNEISLEYGGFEFCYLGRESAQILRDGDLYLWKILKVNVDK